MRGYIGGLLLSAVLAAPLVTTGCAEHHYYRVYDPYNHDYHRWDNNEVVYYNQWAVETHHDPHRDFRKLNQDDQKNYWNWRHSHGDNDHDHDHDHDHH
ncbi:MAG TPA: hypothetical protein VMH85_07485 [Terriglobales bacterium]|nr:hypothetical protein [Terriglobales bacterium]